MDNKPNRKNRYHKKETEAVRPSVPAPPQQSSLVQSQKPLPETAAPKDEEAPAALPERTAEIFPAVSVETLAPQAEPEPEPESSTAAHDSKPPVYNARKHHEEKAKIVDYKKLTSPGERRAPQSDFMTHLLSSGESQRAFFLPVQGEWHRAELQGCSRSPGLSGCRSCRAQHKKATFNRYVALFRRGQGR